MPSIGSGPRPLAVVFDTQAPTEAAPPPPAVVTEPALPPATTTTTPPPTSTGTTSVPPGPWNVSAPSTTETERVRVAVGLPNDTRGKAMARTLVLLGYSELEQWKFNPASAMAGPNEDGVPLPVLRNPATGGVVVMHEAPEAKAAWKNLVASAPVHFSGRFSWTTDKKNGVPEATLILKHGAEPYHLAEEHFHHQFSRANLIRLSGQPYVTLDQLPRVGDTEIYAATMAHRFLLGDALLADYTWNGQEDIANAVTSLSNADLLQKTLNKQIDIMIASPPSADTGDGRPMRPGRSLGRLSQSEWDSTGIARFPTSTQLDWQDLDVAKVPWSAKDEASTTLKRTDL